MRKDRGGEREQGDVVGLEEARQRKRKEDPALMGREPVSGKCRDLDLRSDPPEADSVTKEPEVAIRRGTVA